MTTGINFALVHKAGPLRLSIIDHDVDDNDAVVSPAAATDASSSFTVRQQLTSIYESYAVLYPNADLAKERQERDTLLRAISAASAAANELLNATPSRQQQQKRGWLGFWFGKPKKEVETSEKKDRDLHKNDENGRLVYHYKDEDDDNDNYDNNARLCGTTRSLDTSCIPPEAHAVARFHLASTRLHHHHHHPTMSIARTAWERPGTALLAVVGLGVLVEHYQTSNNADDDKKVEARVMYTSDRHELLEYCRQHQQQQQQQHASSTSFCVAYTRAALIGPNLLMVSWGFADGYVVFYRRLAAGHDDDNDDDGKDWQAVATTGPTQAVIHQVRDMFDDDQQQQHSLSTPLLRVTDLVPLVLERDKRIPAATVAIARLGGFIELVPLPHAMWYGPELNVPSTTKRRKRNVKKKLQSHYAAGQVPNLAAEDTAQRSSIQVMTTQEYHSDVLALDAFRTSVEEDVMWDKNKYPDSPPAEYVLAATGTREGRETMTFWSCSTIYNVISDQQQKQQDPIGFSILVQLSEALDLGPVGPEISIFATSTILEHWRKPRRVELRPEQPPVNGDDNVDDLADNDPEEKQVTSISVPAPITCIRFLQQDDMIQAAVLDWNGGVTVFDCALLERATSHSLEHDEYELLHRNPDPDAVVPLVAKLNSRAAVIQQVATALSNSTSYTSIPVISNIEWFGTPLALRPRDRIPRVAVITSMPSYLHLVDPTNSTGLPISVELPSHRSTALHRFQLKARICLISASREKDSVYFSSLDQLEAQEIVRTLARENKLQEAITTSQSLGVSDQTALADVIESCKQKLWESKHDFHSLEHITDNRYVVDQALKFAALHDEEAPFDLFRRVHLLALKRLSNAPQRLGPTLALGGLEGIEAIIDSMRERFIKVGTYELLCQYFGIKPSFSTFHEVMLPLRIEDLAIYFAWTCDISALSLICFRHRFPCLVGPWVLDSLPLTVDVQIYQHLLPVAKGIHLFLDDRMLKHISEMPSFIQLHFGIESIVGEEDERVIIENSRSPIDVVESIHGSLDTDRITSLEEWYISRLKGIEMFLSSPRILVAFADVALFALGIDTESSRSMSLSPGGEQLWKLRLRYHILSELLLEQGNTFMSGMPSSGMLDLEKIVEMKTIDLLGVAIGEHVDPASLLSRYKRFFLPLVEQKLGNAEGSFPEEEPETIVYPFCARAVSGSSDASTMRCATGLCAAFVNLSRSDIPNDSRVVKKKESTMSFVSSVVDSILEGCSELNLSIDDCKQILENLWTMYESLPVSDTGLDLGEEYAVLCRSIDSLFQDLVAVDLLYRWIGRNAFSLALKRRRADDRVVPNVSKDMVVAICRSFFDKIQQAGGTGLGADKLVRLLLQDLDDISRLCFKETLSLLDTVTAHLLVPLLKLRHIQLLGVALSEIDQDWINKELMKGEVNSFVNGILVANGDNFSSDSLRVAIDCQDILGEYLGGSNELFGGLRRSLEAANFINSVLLPNAHEGSVAPGALRRKSALTTIAELLSENPFLAIHETPGWQDPVWAMAANKSIRGFHERNKTSMLLDEDGVGHETPPQPPGTAILHLAQLLGITQDEEIFTVKLILIRVSAQNKLNGAAAAVCRTFFVDPSSREVNCHILSAVADIVSNETYDDPETKKELCELVLASRLAAVTLESSFHYERIVAAFGETECSMLGRNGLVNPVVAFERLCRDTSSEYSVDLAELFTTLRKQTLELSIDDELLNTLARYTFFWCIAQSTRPKYGDPIPFDFLSIQSNLSLASAFTVHIDNSNLRSECCIETKTTFEQQRDTALERHQVSLSHQWVKPDEATVRRLVGRGYGELGARRAVSMTGNKGFDAAVQWAVLHCLDNGFDSPIIILKPSDELTFNIPGIDYMSRVLEELFNTVNGGNMRCFIPTDYHDGTKKLEEEDRSHSKPSSIVHKNSSKVAKESSSMAEICEGKPKLNLARLQTNKSLAVKISRVPEPKQKLQVSDSAAIADATGSATGYPSAKADAPPQPAAKTTGAKITNDFEVESAVPGNANYMNGKSPPATLETKPEIPEAFMQQNIFRAKTLPEKVQPISSPSKISHPVPPPPPPRPKLDLSRLTIPKERSTLRERGEAALKTARSTSQSPSRDDRKRLIEEGRRLLQKARSASGSTPKAAVPLASPVQRRPLRSRVTRTFPSPPSSPKALKQAPRPPASTPPSQRQAPPPPPPKQDEMSDAGGWDFDEGDLDL